MSGRLTVECQVHFTRGPGGRRKVAREGAAPLKVAREPGRVPRVARLMALAIKFDGLIREGAIRDYAELSRLGHVTRARITQVMNLLHLASDIQEDLLHLPRTVRGRDPVLLADLQQVAQTLRWADQRRLWRALRCQRMPSGEQ